MKCTTGIKTKATTRVLNETPFSVTTKFTNPLRPSLTPRQPYRRGTRVIVRAEDTGSFDVEAFVQKFQDKFEKAENKPVVIGYGVGALLALFITEWLIHLPGLDFILGFPIQLVGVLMAPLLVIRYLIDKKDLTEDTESTLEKVVDLLPGLKK